MISKSDIENALRVDTAVSDEMSKAIRLWSDMYDNEPPWKSGTVQTLNLPAVIASRLAKLVTLEAECTIDGGARAEWLEEQLSCTLDKLRNITEYALAKGGFIFKPYINDGKIVIDHIQADRFYPTKYNSNGEITSGIFVAQKTYGKTIYTRLELHEYEGVKYTVTNRAYRSTVFGVLGTSCSLDEVDEWARLEPETEINNLSRPLFVYWKMPFANNIDDTSPLGVSVYSRAAETIEQADKQFSRLLWEFEGGELAIYASRDMFYHKMNGDLKLPKGKERLFNILDDGKNSNENLFDHFSPTLRDTSLLNGLNTLLRQIEQQCGLAFGTFSDPETVAKTATEIASTRQESYSTVSDVQKSLETAITQLTESVVQLGIAAHLTPAGDYKLSFKWDDSIIVDKEARKEKFWQYVTAGKFPFWKYLVEFEGYSESDARALSLETDMNNPFGFEGENNAHADIS